MSNLTDLQKTLLLIFRHIGMPADEAGAVSLFLTKCNLEQEMLDWLMEHPLSTPQDVLDSLSRMLKARRRQDSLHTCNDEW
jgi:hypothetical protein